MVLEFGNIEEFFLRILKANDILQENRLKAVKDLNEDFPAFIEVHHFLLDETVALVHENPQQLIDLVRSSLFDSRNIMTLAAHREELYKPEKNAQEKMRFIAVCYELASLFRLGAFLLTSRRAPIDSLQNPMKIFKTYKRLGIDFPPDKMRLIRNAISHRFTVLEDKILDQDDNEVVSITELNSIYEKLFLVFTWYPQVLMNFGWWIPKFGLLIGNTIYYEITENKPKYQSYYSGLKLIMPESAPKEEVKEIKEPTFAPGLRGFFQKVRYRLTKPLVFKIDAEIRLSKNYHHDKPKYRSNLLQIESHLGRQIDQICDHLEGFQLDNEDDIRRIKKTIGWLKEQKPVWLMRIGNSRRQN